MPEIKSAAEVTTEPVNADVTSKEADAKNTSEKKSVEEVKKEDTKKEEVKKPATDSKASTDTSKSAASEKKPAESVKKDTKKEEAKNSIKLLDHPVVTYRGPDMSLAGKSYAGNFKVLEDEKSSQYVKCEIYRPEGLGCQVVYLKRSDIQ